MNIAEIDRATGRVVNVLIAEHSITDAPDAPTFHVEYTDTKPAWVGLGYSAEHGFEQPPTESHWADDYVPAEAAPTITPEEFERILKEHEAESGR